jgi:lipoate-protein ligase A
VKALQKLNINASYKPPNDIHLSGKKISGSGLLKKNQCILVHGTILHSTDLTIMHHALKKSSQTTPVTTLQNEQYIDLTIIDLQNALLQQFSSLFTTTFNPSSFTIKEKALIDTLIQTRYSQPQWNTMR